MIEHSVTDDRQFRFGRGKSVFVQCRTRKAILEASNRPSATIFADYVIGSCSSLVIDDGTIERRHLLHIMSKTPSSFVYHEDEAFE